MKKVLFSLVALMAVMTVQAQSLCGTWRSIQPVIQTEEDGSLEIQNFTYTFNEDGTFSLVDEFTMSTEPSQTMALEVATSIEVKGAYTLDGDKLTLTPDAKTFKADILSISMNGKVADNPMIKSQINGMLNSAEFKNEFCAVDNYTITVNDSMLQMNDGEESLSLTRFATIKN